MRLLKAETFINVRSLLRFQCAITCGFTKACVSQAFLSSVSASHDERVHSKERDMV